MLAIIEIYDVKQKENVVLRADLQVVDIFDKDSTLKEVKEYVYSNEEAYQKAKRDLEECETLYALNITEDEILDYVCVFLSGENGEVIIDSMEWDDRVVCEVALCC